MAREGVPVILLLLLVLLVLAVGAIVTHQRLLWGLVAITGAFILFSVYFFRDPHRIVPAGDNLILAPADGKIIVIEKVNEPEFFKGEALQVSIFMSAFNVHVNRVPITGQVVYFNYRKGAYHPAYKDEASFSNEQSAIGIQNDNIQIFMKQIAGIFARRIVCHLREGHKVKAGERFGMIKFGSRIDLFLPISVQLQVKMDQKVTAGTTIIGTYTAR
ncbi:MAG: phosphatidylserine decarboxylase family protein [candidate division KSB1 bacterium]|nr:phosphatidylserine decarboxylase family protein [candidate division KSB1 bacterium]MDZ7339915.1 phosphatidylserine decarboxylase family protein [candidate division KSB1 bacterium]